MELQSPENLLLNLSAAGRSNDETSSTKTQWSFIDKTGSINNSLEYQKNTSFSNFNWYNNGWDGECLRISNGASIDIDFPGAFVYNQSSSTSKTKSATFEVRFKVKNVKNYSTLITNKTYYYIDGNPVLESEIPEGAVVDTLKDPLTGVDTGFPIITIEKVINTQEGVFCSFYDEATKAGFSLGTQEAYFSTGGETVSVRYTEDEIITISMVVAHFNNATQNTI